MPFHLRKAPRRPLYWVVDDTGKHYSKDPMPKERARQQQKALYAAEGRGELRGGMEGQQIPIPQHFAARGRLQEQRLGGLLRILEEHDRRLAEVRRVIAQRGDALTMEEFEQLQEFHTRVIGEVREDIGLLDELLRDARTQNEGNAEALARIEHTARVIRALARLLRQQTAPLLMPAHLQPPRGQVGGARPRFCESRYF